MAFIIDETTNARKLIKTETDGITLSQIAECLRDYRVNTSGKLDLGLLATSAKINKWAKYRPFEPAGNKTNEQTEQTRKQGAYGFYWWNINQEADAPFARTASALLTKAINNNGEWKVRPLTTYRIADFNGYDNSAERPYDYYTFEQNYMATRKMYIANILERRNIQIRLSDMPDIEGYNDAISDWSVVFIYKDESGTIRTVDTGMTVEELHGSGNGADNISTYAEVSLTPVTDDSTKKYDYVWAATNANLASSEEVTWLYFPESDGQMELVAAFLAEYSYNDAPFVLLDNMQNIIDETDKSTLIHYVQFGLSFTSQYEFPIKVECKLRYLDSSSSSNQEYSSTKTISGITASEIAEFFDTYHIGDYVDTTSNNLKLALEIRTYNSNTNVLLSTQHLNLLTGKLENGTANMNTAPTAYEINNNGVL
jgi:hypothetical protein